MQLHGYPPRPSAVRLPLGARPDVRRALARVRRDRRLGVAAVVGGTALVAVALALAMPRGPVTARGGLVTVVAALALGLGAGFALRSRWPMLLAPAAFAAVFELRWLGVEGPTVDGFRFDDAYGIVALVVGRGFFGLLAFLPLLLGVALGAALARRVAGAEPTRTRLRSRAGLWARRLVTALAALAVAALVVLLARPGSTPAITGPDGDPLPGSIAVLERVELRGGTQWIQIRGRSVDAPVLLYLHGGPGQSGLPFTRILLGGLERDFVVVDWDQRGDGKSHGALEPVSTYTLDSIVDDTVELSRSLADRFGERKIYLAGTSWGSTLGVLAVQRAPDAFHAFVGGGQMVSQLETDRRIYRDLAAHAARVGDDGIAARLRELGEPPYEDVFAYAWVMQQYELLVPEYELLPAVERLGEEHFRELGPWGVLGREYDLVEKVNVMRGLMETFAVLYPQLQGIDFRRDVPALDVPVYVFRGTGELAARDELALEWFDALAAPRKRLFTLDHAGHAVLQERADRLHAVLLETVLPETYGAGRASTETKGATP